MSDGVVLPPPPPRRTRPARGSATVRGVAAACLAVAAVAVAVLARRHPADLGFLPPCPTASLGFACAGCGSTRALHFLLQGDLAAAWRHNPALLVVGVPSALVAGGACLVALVRGAWPRSPLSPRLAARLGFVLVIALVGWSIARNLPGEAFTSLRPPAARR